MTFHYVFRCLALGGLSVFTCAGHAGPTATSHEFVNFNNQVHLTSVNVLPAWSAGLTGAPVTVAVVDSGVDLQHPDLVGSFAGGGRDFVNGGGIRSDDFTSHGTLISGLITGNFNEAGIVGIAYDAKVLPIKAFHGPFGGGIEVLQAIDYAASRGDVRIINLSLGGPLLGPAEISTVQGAAARGKLLVMAAGNDTAADPDFPARLAPQLSGRGIAVGALGADGNIAAFSNRAGVTRDYFLLAPGTDIWSTVANGSFAPVSGTSFSTAYVSGAAALLAQLFPNLAVEEIAEILLVSATDLGAPGPDSTYGRGRLNIGAAVQPIGTLTVPTPSSAGAPLTAQGALVAPALAAALRNPENALDRALALDRYHRAYAVDLTRLLRTRATHRRWERVVAGARDDDMLLAITPTQSLGVGYRIDHAARSALDSTPDPTHGGVEFSAAAATLRLFGTSGNADYRLAFNDDAPGGPGFGTATNDNSWFLGTHTLRSPYLGFSDREHRFQIRWPVGAGAKLYAGVVSQDNDSHPDTEVDSQAAFVQAQWRLGKLVRMQLRASHLEEHGSLFGGAVGGSFGVDRARTRGFGVTTELQLRPSLTLVGNWDLGETHIDHSATSLLQDFDGVRSDAFSVGLLADGLFRADDHGGVAISRPLRIKRGATQLIVPRGMDRHEAISFTRRSLTLEPGGHEIDLDMFYQFSPYTNAHIATHLFVRNNPNHDNVGDIEVMLMGTLKWSF